MTSRVGQILRLALPLLALLALAVAIPVHGQEPIQVQEQSHEYRFAERLVFRLRAQSESEIVQAKVFFQFGSFDPLNNDQPERFQPAREIDVEVVRHLQRGLIAPAQEITYWWRIEDAEGNRLETEEQSFFYLDERFDWQQRTEGQLTVFHYDQSEGLVRQILETSQQALERLAEQVGVRVDHPIKLVVYASREDMQKALVFRGETFEGQIITLGTVVAEDIVVLLGSDPGLDVTIFHELTHVVAGLATDNPFAEMPAWLNEGLASYNEGGPRTGYQRAVEQACASNTLMSVRSITSSTVAPERVTLFYAESRSLVEFLLQEHGQEKFLQLLEVIKEGNLIDTALAEVYGFDQDGLEDRWRAWLGCPPAPGRQAPPVEVEPTATPAPQVEAPRPTATPAPEPQPAAADPRIEALRRTLTFLVAASAGGAALLAALIVVLLARR